MLASFGYCCSGQDNLLHLPLLTKRNELISRVAELITAERKRLERQRYEEERFANGNATSDPAAGEGAEDGVESKKVPTGPMPEMERGLCVVCQDEEATLAVVDCGYVQSHLEYRVVLTCH